MDSLYLHLEPIERARLLARLVREDDREGLERLRLCVPSDQSRTYNRALAILRNLLSPLHQILRGLLYGAERDVLGLGLVFQHWRDRQRLHWQMASLWDLLPYPITEGEYHSLIEQERQEILSLKEFAQYIRESFTGDETELRPEVLTALRAIPEDAADADVARAIRAVIERAITQGELPAPTRTRQGRALPWGTLADWLEPLRAGASEPLSPDAVIPAVRMLGGLAVRWDVRPDAEDKTVQTDRERILARLAAVAGVSSDTSMNPHVPQGKAERDRAEREAQAAWPWPREAELRTVMLAIGRRQAEVRGELQAIRAAVETIQREDFGGEDPLLPVVRELLTAAWGEVRAFEESWTTIGEIAGGQYGAAEPWPAVPDIEPERQADIESALLAYLRREE